MSKHCGSIFKIIRKSGSAFEEKNLCGCFTSGPQPCRTSWRFRYSRIRIPLPGSWRLRRGRRSIPLTLAWLRSGVDAVWKSGTVTFESRYWTWDSWSKYLTLTFNFQLTFSRFGYESPPLLLDVVSNRSNMFSGENAKRRSSRKGRARASRKTTVRQSFAISS